MLPTSLLQLIWKFFHGPTNGRLLQFFVAVMQFLSGFFSAINYSSKSLDSTKRYLRRRWSFWDTAGKNFLAAKNESDVLIRLFLQHPKEYVHTKKNLSPNGEPPR